MSIAEVVARFTADTSGVDMAMKRVNSSINKTAYTMSRAGTMMGVSMGAAGAAVAVGLGVAVKTAMDFEAQIDRVGAISGASGADLQKLRQAALDLGASTSKSATEVAQGMELMAAAGFETNEVIAAMPGVIAAAEASGEDMAVVTEVVTAALNGFKLEASQATHVADVMAMAANRSSASVQDLGYAFKYAAPVAKQLGFSIEELAAMTAVMSDAGIKGEQAGTSLRMSLTRLVKPTAEVKKGLRAIGVSLTDAQGKMKPAPQLLNEIMVAMNGVDGSTRTAAAAQIFGTEAMSGMLAVIDAGPAKLQRLTKAFENSDGAAKRTAKQMKDNLKGALEEMQGALETAAIAIGDALAPAVRKVADWIKNLANGFNGLSDSMKSTIAISAAIGSALAIIGGVVGFIIAGIGAAIPVIVALGSTFWIVIGAITAVIAIVGTLYAHWDKLTAKGNTLGKVILALTFPFSGLVKAIKSIEWAFSESIPEVDRFGNKVSDSTKKALGSYFKLEDGALSSLKRLYWGGDKVTKDSANQIIKNFKEMADQVISGLEQKKGEANKVMGQWFSASAVLPDGREKEILGRINKFYDNEIKEVENGEKRAKEILNKAAKEKRDLTAKEYSELESIMYKFRTKAVENLTKSEQEQKIIWERIANNSSEINARQAADIVKTSKKATDKVIKDAAKVRDEKIAWAIKARDEMGVISDDEAQKLITNAKHQYDETVTKAKDKHRKVVDEAKAQAKEHVNEVNWETGQIKSNWEVVWDSITNGAKSAWDTIKNTIFSSEWWAQKWEDLKNVASEKWTAFTTWLGTKWEEFKSWAGTKWDEIIQGIVAKWESLKQTAIEKWEAIKTWVLQKIESLKQQLLTKWETLKQNAIQKWEELKNWAIQKWEAIKSRVVEKVETMKQQVTNKWEQLKTWVTNKVEALRKNIISKWESIKQWVIDKAQGLKDKVIQKFEELKSKISSKVEEARSRLSSKFTDMVNTAKRKAGDIVTKVIDKIEQLPGKMYDWARNAVEMFADGIMSKIGSVVSAAKSLADKVESYLGFHSPTEKGPASDSDHWAPNFVKMFADGLVAGVPWVEKAANKLVQPLEKAFTKTDKFKEMGVQISKGMTEGIKYGSPAMKRAVEESVNRIAKNDPLVALARSIWKSGNSPLAKYFDGIFSPSEMGWKSGEMHDGDWMNDWIYKIPKEIRGFTAAIGELVATRIDPKQQMDNKWSYWKPGSEGKLERVDRSPIVIQNMHVRSDNDIKAIAVELDKLQNRRLRAKGRVR
jgi:TP901 family phage tail tape measure protein